MYHNSFWDTVKGHKLADILIECLPIIVKNAAAQKQAEQYTKLIECNKAQDCIEFNLQLGAKVVYMESYTDNNKNMMLIIFERRNKRWLKR